ncbi:MAG: TonB-dependent receptor [Leisingera sp.]
MFEDATSWTASVSYTFADNGVRLHSPAGTGIVNPSNFELFANSTFCTTTYLGNPNLHPEKNRSFDFGVEVPLLQGRGLVDVTWDDEARTGEIESYMVKLTTFSYRYQAGDSDRQGVELSANMEATEYLDLLLSYTYLDASNSDGSVEVRRPEHEMQLSATLQTSNGRGLVTTDIRHG